MEDHDTDMVGSSQGMMEKQANDNVHRHASKFAYNDTKDKHDVGLIKLKS